MSAKLSLFVLLTLASIPVFAGNVVFFLGDGMGISTITAARIYAGQQLGNPGEEHDLAFDKFDNVALIKTYNVDAQVSDSAGTITAIMTGQKTRIGVVGVDATVPRDDCSAALDNSLPSIAELAEEKGYFTGVISTARITHATPAGSYAHVPNRNWEDDSTLPIEAAKSGCLDIARQLIEPKYGDGPEVILGGGRANFMGQKDTDPEYPFKGGKRLNEINLIEQWLAKDTNRRYVWNAEQFREIVQEDVPNLRLMGLFEPSHMQFEADREKDKGGEPSLVEMTKYALNQAKKSNKPYFLSIEGGRIDHGHHASNAYRALTDTVVFSDAVEWVVNNVNLEDTLILVTADHSHTLTISGYPKRGNPILGLVETVPPLGSSGTGPHGGIASTDAIGLPYTTLSYANGGGYRKNRPNLSKVDTREPNYLQLSTVPMMAETHAGEDVAAFAIGLNSEKVRGVMEQNELFGVMQDALFLEK